VNWTDYFVLISTLLAIASYGLWSSRKKRNLHEYLKGSSDTPWITIGLSVMATQASAITFLSTPGQGYEDGLGFVQNYFGAPIALIIISVVFLPYYRKLNVYTAYEFLGHRFDKKTSLLGATLFLIQRGLGAGITIYAPAIVLSTVMGWNLNTTIILSGLLVIVYTTIGGNEAVNVTQKYQFGIILIGMFAAFIIILKSMPSELSIHDTFALAGLFKKLDAVDCSVDVHKRYTVYSGILGGLFLALAYFGTDQSQVQRYLSGSSLRESRLGLMFNAIFKIPMQVFILGLGILIFIFYRFEKPPLYFNQPVWNRALAQDSTGDLKALDKSFTQAHNLETEQIKLWLKSRKAGNLQSEVQAKHSILEAHATTQTIRKEAAQALINTHIKGSSNDSDYVFVSFILSFLPHGLIGLLIAAFFAAALSSKAGELSALGTTTLIDLYRPLAKNLPSDKTSLLLAKLFTVIWGLVAIAFALFASLTENLIQAVNIVGSIFYGVVLGLFLVAFFIRSIQGTAVFWAAIMSQTIIFYLYYTLSISYLWYNVIGCGLCVLLSLVLEGILPKTNRLKETLS
jgi:Na+/proline symporter